MTRPSKIHQLSRSFRYALLTILAVFGLAASLVPSATSAQEDSALLYAGQLFQSITEHSSTFLGGPYTLTHTPEGTFTGYAGPAQFGEILSESFSNIDFRIQSIAQASDDWVIASFILTGIHTGDYQGLEANCAAIEVPGIALLHFGEYLAQVDNPDSGTLGQYLDPVMETRSHIVEQWLEYDEALIGGQIEVFNDIQPNLRPGCADWTPVAPGTNDALPPTTDEPVQWENPY